MRCIAAVPIEGEDQEIAQQQEKANELVSDRQRPWKAKL
jgi:hypothetical protein